MKLISPVYAKELVQIAINRRLAWLKVLYLAALFVVTVICLWQFDGRQGVSRAQNGQLFFMGIAFTDLIAVLLFTPLVTGGCIVGEREANTLGLLLITRLTPWNIVQDKGLSRLSHMLYISALTFPFLAVALLIGGIELYQILAAAAYIVGTVLLCGALAMFFSALRRTHVRAISSTYVYLFLYFVVGSILAGIAAAVSDAPGPILALNPVYGLAMVVESHLGAPVVILGASLYFLMTLGGYVLAVGLASAIVRRRAGRPKPVAAADGATDAPGESWRQRLIKPVNLRAVRMLSLDREHSFSPAAAGRRLAARVKRHPIIAGLVLTLVSLPGVVSGVDPYRSFPLYATLLAVALPILTLSVIIKAATSISQERQHNRLPILMATAYRGTDVVNGIYRAVIAAFYPFYLVVGVIIIAGSVLTINNSDWHGQLCVALLPTLLFYTNFIILLAMRISLACKTNARALSATFVLLLVLSVGPMFAAGLFGFLAGDAAAGFTAMLSPPAVIGCCVETGLFKEILDDYGGGVVANILVYSVLSGMLYSQMALQFDRLIGRQPGASAGASRD